MHLLGASVVGFILLPLAFSCEISEQRKKISQDYKFIIEKQLQHIKDIVGEPENCSEISNNIKYSIHNISCYHIPKWFEKNPEKVDLKTKLKQLVENIKRSIGCQCPFKQGQQRAKTRGQRGQRKKKSLVERLCSLKHSLAKIQNAYEQYNSAP